MHAKNIDYALKKILGISKKTKKLLRLTRDTKNLFDLLEKTPRDNLLQSIQECKTRLEELGKALEESKKDFSSITGEIYGKFFLEMRIQLEDFEKSVEIK